MTQIKIGEQYCHKNNLKSAFRIVAALGSNDYLVANYGWVLNRHCIRHQVIEDFSVLSSESIVENFLEFNGEEYQKILKSWEMP